MSGPPLAESLIFYHLDNDCLCSRSPSQAASKICPVFLKTGLDSVVWYRVDNGLWRNAMKTLKIGELAKRAEIGVETVRFYERQGLLDAPQRLESGYRQYREETVEVLRFIRRAKELGFTLKEIRSLLDLRSDESAPRSEIRKQASSKIEEIDAKIADLQRMRTGLMTLVGQCHGDSSLVGCPIMDALKGIGQTSSQNHVES